MFLRPQHLENITKRLLKNIILKKSSDIFLFLPLTTDGKETINQHKENVPLNPLDCNYENFKNFHPEKKDFYPQHLDLNVSDKRRKVAVEICIMFLIIFVRLQMQTWSVTLSSPA